MLYFTKMVDSENGKIVWHMGVKEPSVGEYEEFTEYSPKVINDAYNILGTYFRGDVPYYLGFKGIVEDKEEVKTILKNPMPKSNYRYYYYAIKDGKKTKTDKNQAGQTEKYYVEEGFTTPDKGIKIDKFPYSDTDKKRIVLASADTAPSEVAKKFNLYWDRAKTITLTSKRLEGEALLFAGVISNAKLKSIFEKYSIHEFNNFEEWLKEYQQPDKAELQYKKVLLILEELNYDMV